MMNFEDLRTGDAFVLVSDPGKNLIKLAGLMILDCETKSIHTRDFMGQKKVIKTGVLAVYSKGKTTYYGALQ